MDWMNAIDSAVRFEMCQRREEGCDLSEIEGRVEDALKVNDAEKLHLLLSELDSLEPAASFPYSEPSDLESIRAERPDGPRRVAVNLTEAETLDRIHGAWLGRAAGCTLGKPVEKWTKAMIDSYLEFARALPLDDYIPLVEGYPEGHPDEYTMGSPECTRGRIEYMARDDDMDYPILGLHLLESKGGDFTSKNVADTWLSRMPYNLLYTAERVAYRNLVNDLWPPESATYRNHFREWIGAQIRADIWGYAAPGWSEKAAALAFRDATVSHVKNGIYGEMFVASMLAAAFVSADVEEIITIGLSEIPKNCRFAEAVQETVGWCNGEDDWELVWAKINEKYGHYCAVHTINNAALVVMALMCGRGDYETTIVTAVRGGWDTDCNGATAGSICGMILGAGALPEKWVGVLNDRLMSAVRGFEESAISDLAQRSHTVAKKIIEAG